MLKIIGRDKFKDTIKTWPDETVLCWVKQMQKLVDCDEVYKLVVWNDFNKMYDMLCREMIVRFERVLSVIGEE